MTEEDKKALGVFLTDPRANTLIEYLEEQKTVKTNKLITGEALVPVIIQVKNKTNIYLHNTVLAEVKAITNLLTFIKNCKEEAKEKTDD